MYLSDLRSFETWSNEASGRRSRTCETFDASPKSSIGLEADEEAIGAAEVAVPSSW